MQQFSCSLCDYTLKYDLNDKTTFTSFEESENRMLGTLITLRVSHNKDNSKHVNVVILDNQGQYRAHKDAYSEKSNLTDSNILAWNTFQEYFPIELSYYLPLADQESKIILSDNFKEIDGKNQTLVSVLPKLRELYSEYQNNNFIEFLHGKCLFLTGKVDEFEGLGQLSKRSWLFPTYLRIESRKKPTQDLLYKLVEFQYNNNILEAEYAISFSEIGLRLGEIEKLDHHFEKYRKKWEKFSNVFLLIAFNLVKAYYGYNLHLQGKIETSRDYIQPAFNYINIVQHKPFQIVIGNFYGSILKNLGDLDEAAVTYTLILLIAKDLDDDPSQVMITSNLGSIEFQRGKIKEAVVLFDELYNSPITKKSISFKISAIVNKSWALQQLGRDDEAIYLLQEALDIEDLSFSFQIAVYQTYLRSIRNTKKIDILAMIEDKIDFNEFRDVPNGEIVIYDLKATRAQLENKWKDVVDSLEKALNIMQENNQQEILLVTELRLAEAYFNLFLDSSDNDYVNSCYNHLDFVRSIAGEEGYHPLLYRVTVLKGIINQELNFFDRARNLYLQAQEYIVMYNLTDYEDQIAELLKSLDEQEEEHESVISSKSLFHQLQNVAQRFISRTRGTDYTVNAILIIDRTKIWSWVGQGDGLNFTDYLAGINDLISLTLDQVYLDSINSVSGSKGVILVESSEEFIIFVIADTENYNLRVNMKKLLENLSKYKLKDVSEERIAFISNEIQEKFGDIKEINL